MFKIEYGPGYCYASYSEPITDEDIWEIMSIRLGDLINLEPVEDAGCSDSELDEDEYGPRIPLEEFIRTKLSPEQQGQVNEYIREEIEKVMDRFVVWSNTKGARS